jgi:hypothetical protein
LIKKSNWKEPGGKDEPYVQNCIITDYYTEEELGENLLTFPRQNK